MTISQNSKDLYFCQVLDTGENVSFYITEDISIKNAHSINTKIAPFTGTGFTQNLGRKEYSVSMSILLTDGIDGTMEQKYNKLMQVKNTMKKVKLNLAVLPLGANNYYIDNCDLKLKEPARLTISLSLTEDLGTAFKSRIQNLIGSNAIEGITTTLSSRGYNLNA